jgi:hypothetical protein
VDEYSGHVGIGVWETYFEALVIVDRRARAFLGHLSPCEKKNRK